MSIAKVLVTGGAGYIGTHVVYSLLKHNYQVMVYDNLSNGIKTSLLNKTKFVKEDICDTNAIHKAIKSFNPDAIIHLAALKSVSTSFSHIQEYTNTNILGTINILNAMLQHGISYFVFSSSAAVFGTPHYLPIDEEHVKFPVNYYGETKLIIEKLLYWYSKSENPPFYYSALRYFNAAGHEPKVDWGIIEQKPENLIPVILETALKKRKKFNIFGNDYNTPDGTCIRDYIHVSDLAQAHVLSLQYLEEKQKSIELNLGTGKGFSTKEVYDMTVKVSQRNIPMNFSERRKGDVESLYAKSVLAKKMLHWTPQYDIEDIILHAWDVYEKHS